MSMTKPDKGSTLKRCRPDERFHVGTVRSIERGRNGPYAVVVCNDPECPYHGPEASITFSCQAPVWQEDYAPTGGDIVCLRNVHEKTRGLRSERVEPVG